MEGGDDEKRFKRRQMLCLGLMWGVFFSLIVFFNIFNVFIETGREMATMTGKSPNDARWDVWALGLLFIYFRTFFPTNFILYIYVCNL